MIKSIPDCPREYKDAQEINDQDHRFDINKYEMLRTLNPKALRREPPFATPRNSWYAWYVFFLSKHTSGISTWVVNWREFFFEFVISIIKSEVLSNAQCRGTVQFKKKSTISSHGHFSPEFVLIRFKSVWFAWAPCWPILGATNDMADMVSQENRQKMAGILLWLRELGRVRWKKNHRIHRWNRDVLSPCEADPMRYCSAVLMEEEALKFATNDGRLGSCLHPVRGGVYLALLHFSRSLPQVLSDGGVSNPRQTLIPLALVLISRMLTWNVCYDF